MGFFARNYGQLRNRRRSGWTKVLIWFAERIILPKVSEWHVLLTPFTLPSRGSVIKVDVLMTDGALYQGSVFKHCLDNNGELAGMIITEPKRYGRQQLLADREKNIEKPTDSYWRPIPSRQMYLMADKIMNINVNYAEASTSTYGVMSFLEEVADRPLPGIAVTISQNPPKQQTN